MTNERGEKVKVARPSSRNLGNTPRSSTSWIEIINGMDDNEAHAIARKTYCKTTRSKELQATHEITLDDIFNQIQQID